MFSLGISEVLVFLTVSLFALGGPIVLVVVLVILLRKRNSSDSDATIARLEEENRRLQNELAAKRPSDTFR